MPSGPVARSAGRSARRRGGARPTLRASPSPPSSTSRTVSARPSPPAVPAGVRAAYHLYVIRLVPRTGESLAAVAARRLQLFNGLRERAVAPQVHYIPVHRQPDFVRAGMAGGDFPGAEAFYAGCLSL